MHRLNVNKFINPDISWLLQGAKLCDVNVIKNYRWIDADFTGKSLKVLRN